MSDYIYKVVRGEKKPVMCVCGGMIDYVKDRFFHEKRVMHWNCWWNVNYPHNKVIRNE